MVKKTVLEAELCTSSTALPNSHALQWITEQVCFSVCIIINLASMGLVVK